MDLLVVLTEWFCSKLLTFRTATQIVKSGQKLRTDFKMLTVLKVRTLDGRSFGEHNKDVHSYLSLQFRVNPLTLTVRSSKISKNPCAISGCFCFDERQRNDTKLKSKVYSYGPPCYTHRMVLFQTPYFSNSDPNCKKVVKNFGMDFKMLTVLKVSTLDGRYLVSTTRMSIATFHFNFVSIR